MKTQKISKGFYKVSHSKGLIYIQHDREIEGQLKWAVWSDDFEIAEYMDGLWITKTEALIMIESEIN
jgi:hypothetical protein